MTLSRNGEATVELRDGADLEGKKNVKVQKYLRLRPS